jgi:hypothetical protein
MYFEPHQYDRPIDKFTQSELNELQLTKEKRVLLGSRLREKNMLASWVKFSWYRNSEKEFWKYYAQEDKRVFCKDIRIIFCISWDRESLILAPGLSTLPKEVLRPFCFITATCWLPYHLHTPQSCPNRMRHWSWCLEKIKYHEHEWQICGDLRVIIGLLLGLQRGYTKCPCLLCEWDSRARDKHWGNCTLARKAATATKIQRRLECKSCWPWKKFYFHPCTSNWEWWNSSLRR